MTSSLEVALGSLPQGITLDKLRKLQTTSEAQERLLKETIGKFEEKYQCSLEEFEARIERREVPEHPSWEDSIEWRNVIENIQDTRVTRSLFGWILNLMKRSGSS